MPARDEGPFVKEERKLLDIITARLVRIIERKRKEDEILEYQIKYSGPMWATFTIELDDVGFWEGTATGDWDIFMSKYAIAFSNYFVFCIACRFAQFFTSIGYYAIYI